MISYDFQKVKDWYLRDDIMNIIINYNKYKYITFMSYNEDGTSNKPRRFLTAMNVRGYKFIMKFCSVYRQPTSMYRDTDNWKITRPFFSLVKEEYQIQRKEFFETGKYKESIHSTDFVIDIDSDSIYNSWQFAYKVVDLFTQFDVMFCIYCTGKKGFQILVPFHKCIPKTYFEIDGKEHNTHEVLAFNIKQYLNDTEERIDMSSYGQLRFVKQQFSLDGRNMCPIIPLTFDEFIDFYSYKEDSYNPYTDIDYWMKTESFYKRGFCWMGKSNMNELDKFLDEFIEKKIGENNG